MEAVSPEEQYFLPQNVVTNQETIPLPNILNTKSVKEEARITPDPNQASQGQNCLGSKKGKLIFLFSLFGAVILIIAIGYVFGMKNSASFEKQSSNKSKISGIIFKQIEIGL